MRQLNQITLRGLDADLQREIRELARREGLSLNKAALRLLEKASARATRNAGSGRIGSSLDHLIGTWTEREAQTLLESIQPSTDISKTSTAWSGDRWQQVERR